MSIVTPAPSSPIPTFKFLDDIRAILGSTKTTLWPILEPSDDEVYSYGGAVHKLTCTGDAGEPFHPFKHVGGIHSLSLDAVENQYLLGEDHADFEFGNGTVDAAFSIGLWILPRDITSLYLMTKFDPGATDREWRLSLASNAKLRMGLHDESSGGYEEGDSDTALIANVWSFVVVTYDGVQADPGVAFYLDGVADGSGTTETGAYTAMEAGATALSIGCYLDNGTPATEYTGRLALPFICGKELSAAEILRLYIIGRELLGLA